ncbi:hypothetical protein R1K95_14825 [Pseudomonas aeruginosa]|nr:hypothetical protein R1K95_14825 [Pseudomonas aeruginosa]
MYAKDISAWARLGYFAASWIVGYYVAGEVIGREWARTSGLVAFGEGIVLRQQWAPACWSGCRGGRRLVGSAS